MSYQTGSATDPDDLMDKLNTFLTGTAGWTADLFNLTTRRAVWSKAGVSCKVMFYWDTNKIGNAMIQTYVGDVALTSQGGAEYTSNTITSNRYTNMMTGPYPSYHFFEDDNYIHVVVERSSGIYRHFGFGQMNKLGDWVGGCYVYSGYWDQNASYIDNPHSIQHHMGLHGGNSNNSTFGPGWHAEGFPDTVAPSKYFRNTISTAANDDDGEDINNGFVFGYMDGPNVQFMALQESSLNGFKPLMPIPFYQWYFGSAPDRARLMGYVPDMRTVNMHGLTVGQEVVVGADTWVVFPVVRPGNEGLSFNQEQSYNYGYAYKKVTT